MGGLVQLPRDSIVVDDVDKFRTAGKTEAFENNLNVPHTITVYVRSDGNDNNTGLENTPEGAFKSLNRAWQPFRFNQEKPDWVIPLPKSVVIVIGQGTYTWPEDTAFQNNYVPMQVSIIGNNTAPSVVRIRIPRYAIEFNQDTAPVYVEGVTFLSESNDCEAVLFDGFYSGNRTFANCVFQFARFGGGINHRHVSLEDKTKLNSWGAATKGCRKNVSAFEASRGHLTINGFISIDLDSTSTEDAGMYFELGPMDGGEDKVPLYGNSYMDLRGAIISTPKGISRPPYKVSKPDGKRDIMNTGGRMKDMLPEGPLPDTYPKSVI